MNQLSWILYWADVLPSLAATINALALISAFFTTWGLIFNLVFGANGRSNSYDAAESAAVAAHFNFTRWLLPTLLLASALTCLVPNRETFYAIAVSEVGEEVLNTPEVGKAREALNAWLDKQIEEVEEDVTD